MEKHIQIIAILWIVCGALGIMGAFLIYFVLLGVSFIPDMGSDAEIILRTTGLGIGIILFIFSAPSLIAGLGFIKRKEWGRILVLICSFLAILNFPLGTVLAVYSIVILMRDETIKMMER